MVSWSEICLILVQLEMCERPFWCVKMAANQYCLCCPRRVAFRCTCCHHAGYCSHECQQQDWTTLHRHEQLIINAKIHSQQSLSFDASRFKKARHRDAYTRPIRRSKQSGDTKSPTKEQVEQEMKRREKHGLPTMVEEPLLEEMEVLLNTMPPALQRVKDSQPNLTELYDQTMAALLVVGENRFGFSMEKEVEGFASENVEKMYEEQRERIFGPTPYQMKRRQQTEYMAMIEETSRIMDQQWRDVGQPERRTVITEQHKTAITHYFRMANLARLKRGLAQLSGESQHSHEALQYQFMTDEFQQRLTHDLFFDGAVDYDTVVRSMDKARNQQLGDMEAVFMFDEALDAAASALRMLAQNEEVRFTGLSFMKDVESQEEKSNFMTSLYNMFSGWFTGDEKQGWMSRFINNVCESVRGYATAEYDHLLEKELVENRFVVNSIEVVDTICDNMKKQVKKAEKKDTLMQKLRDKLTDGLRDWTEWLRENGPRAAITVAATVAATLVVVLVGRYWTAPALLSLGLLNVKERIRNVYTTVIHTILPTLQSDRENLEELNGKLAKLHSDEVLNQKEVFIKMDITGMDLIQHPVGLTTQLTLLRERLREGIVKALSDPREYGGWMGEGTTALMQKAAEELDAIPFMTNPEQVRSTLVALQQGLKTQQLFGDQLGLNKSLDDYIRLITDVRAVLQQGLANNRDIQNAVQWIEKESQEVGDNVIALHAIAERTEVKAPLMGQFLQALGQPVDSSRLPHVLSVWGWLSTYALAGLGVMNVASYLAQSETRTNELVSLLARDWSQEGVSWPRMLLDIVWGVTVNPATSAFITIYYMIHSGYVLASLPTLVANASWFRFIKWLVGLVKRGLGSLWGATKEEAPHPAMGAAEELAVFDDEEVRATVKKLIDGWIRREFPVEEIVTRLKERFTQHGEVQYAVGMSYLRDHVLQHCIEELSHLPEIAAPQGSEKERHLSVNASQYLAAYLKEGDDEKKTAWFAPLKGIVDDVYWLTGWFALSHQFTQFYAWCKMTVSVSTQIASLAGGYTALTTLAAILVGTAGAGMIREAWQQRSHGRTVLQSIIPVGAVLWRFIRSRGFIVVGALHGVLLLMSLWNNAYWILATGSTTYQAVTSLLNPGQILPENMFEQAAQMKENALALFERNASLAEPLRVIDLESQAASSWTNGVLDMALCNNGTTVVSDSRSLTELMIRYAREANVTAQRIVPLLRANNIPV